jgi:hypothetical protein
MRRWQAWLVVPVATVLGGSALLIAALFAATPASASSCAPGVSGKPGIVTYTLHINSDPCGEAVRARAECVESIPSGDPYDPPYVYTAWANGPSVYSGGTTSEINCSIFNVQFLSYGWENYYSSGWHYHQLGSG